MIECSKRIPVIAIRRKGRCLICDFDIENAEHKGRQWGGRIKIGEGQICGYCLNEIEHVVGEKP